MDNSVKLGLLIGRESDHKQSVQEFGNVAIISRLLRNSAQRIYYQDRLRAVYLTFKNVQPLEAVEIDSENFKNAHVSSRNRTGLHCMSGSIYLDLPQHPCLQKMGDMGEGGLVESSIHSNYPGNGDLISSYFDV